MNPSMASVCAKQMLKQLQLKPRPNPDDMDWLDLTNKDLKDVSSYCYNAYMLLYMDPSQRERNT